MRLQRRGRHVPGLGRGCAPPARAVGHCSRQACSAACAKGRVRDAAGPLLLIVFAVVTWYYSLMLVNAYRYPNVDGPTRNYTYIQAVRRYLGARLARALCHPIATCRSAACAACACLLSCGAPSAGFPYMVCCGIVQYVQHVWHRHRVRPRAPPVLQARRQPLLVCHLLPSSPILPELHEHMHKAGVRPQAHAN